MSKRKRKTYKFDVKYVVIIGIIIFIAFLFINSNNRIEKDNGSLFTISNEIDNKISKMIINGKPIKLTADYNPTLNSKVFGMTNTELKQFSNGCVKTGMSYTLYSEFNIYNDKTCDEFITGPWHGILEVNKCGTRIYVLDDDCSTYWRGCEGNYMIAFYSEEYKNAYLKVITC